MDDLAEFIGGWADEFATQQDHDDAFELALSHMEPEVAQAIGKHEDSS